MKTGFIGLGNLGKNIAKRLISEGVDITVWNRTKEKATDLGVGIAASPAALISDSDIVLMNLFDSEAVKSVIFGKEGLLEGNIKGKIIIDTTTNHFESVLAFHEVIAKHEGAYLEAPVLGSVIPASQGNLTVLVSGAKDPFDRARPLLDKIGRNIFHLEEPALATKMKLINNLALGCFMAALAEAIAFGEDAGIDKSKVIDVLMAGAGNSGVLSAKKDKLLREDFSAHFSSALIYKDLHYLQDLARTLKRPLYTGSLAKELFGMTFSRGEDHLDFSAVYRIMKEF